MLVVVVDILTHRVVVVVPTHRVVVVVPTHRVVVGIVDAVVIQKVTTMLMGQIQKQITFCTFY